MRGPEARRRSRRWTASPAAPVPCRWGHQADARHDQEQRGQDAEEPEPAELDAEQPGAADRPRDEAGTEHGTRFVPDDERRAGLPGDDEPDRVGREDGAALSRRKRSSDSGRKALSAPSTTTVLGRTRIRLSAAVTPRAAARPGYGALLSTCATVRTGHGGTTGGGVGARGRRRRATRDR